jgi:hypothetical protein
MFPYFGFYEKKTHDKLTTHLWNALNNRDKLNINMITK